jgi:hypothetical protein
MHFFGFGRTGLVLCVAAVSVAGCGGTPMAAGGIVTAPASFSRAVTGPPACNGQRTTKKFGDITTRLRAKGAAFCIPAFGGFGGTMEYPGAGPAVKLTIRTSTENIYDEPQLGTGTSIVYLNLHFHAGTHFRSNLKSKGGLTSETIDAGDVYTAYGIVQVGHLVLMFPPCYALATQGPYGGVLPNLGHLFSGTGVTGAGYGVIEVYSGAQVSEEC